MIFNMTGGGGNTSMPMSSIIVVAPSGSIVTCSMGDVTKTSVEENGVWTFEKCDLGVWTVTAELNGNIATKDVEIKQQDQLFRYFVTLSYFNAFITATYPSGSICTCTKADVTITAPDTSGSFTFTVPEAGDWVISCNNGLSGDEYKEKSETVTITEDGQSKSVALNYHIYLYKNGNQHVSITGGWTSVSSANNVILFNTDHIYCYHNGGSGVQGVVFTINKIDVSKYSKLIFYIDAANLYYQTYGASVLGIATGVSHTGGETYQMVAYRRVDIAGEDLIYDVDISNVSGEYYIKMYVADKLHIYSIYME